MHYGIDYCRNYTLEEIAAKYGITYERARQIKMDIFKKLRKGENSNILRELAHGMQLN